MRKVILYGELGNRFGREHHFSVRSASEALQAMCVNFPGFKDFMKNAHKYGIGFKVFVGHTSLKRSEDSVLPSGDAETIRISPAVFGSGAATRILVGAVLIAAGVLLIPTGPVSGAAINVGIALVLGGVFELLSGPPQTHTGQEGLDVNGQSFIFSGPENVTRQGGAVPIGYGRMMVGSTVVSAGIEDEDQ